MNIEQKNVLDFMQKFEQETPTKPTIPNSTIRRLRAELILEEALETIYALGFKLQPDNVPELVACDTVGTLEEVADGLGDKHYVGYCGTGVAYGIDMEPIMEEIHRSNMTKLWTDAEYTSTEMQKYYSFKQVSPGDPMNPHLRIWLVRDSRGKVIKSPSYSPANLKPIIEAQMK